MPGFVDSLKTMMSVVHAPKGSVAEAATTLVWVAVGGAVGAAVRYGAGEAVVLMLGRKWLPVATLSVNVLGCLLIGYLAARMTPVPEGLKTPAAVWFNRPLLVVGFCGALTTFSALAFELVTLMELRRYAWAGILLALHVTLGISALLVGRAAAG